MTSSLMLAAALAVRVLLTGAPENHESTEAWRRALVSTGAYEVRVVEEPALITPAVASRYDVVVANGVKVRGAKVVTVRPAAGVAGLLRDVSAATGAAGRSASVQRVRVLVVTGGHDYDPSFDSVFEGWPDLQVTVDPHPNAFSRDLAKRFDVVVLYDMIPDLPDARKKNLQAYLASGRGLVALHHALCSYDGQDWWRQVTGGQYPQQGGSYQHDRDLLVRRTGVVHPVVEGIPDNWALHDETYKGLRFAEGNTVLLNTADSTADGPLVWISAWPTARVVSIQPGHNRESHYDPVYRRLIHNAIRWSAGPRQ